MRLHHRLELYFVRSGVPVIYSIIKDNFICQLHGREEETLAWWPVYSVAFGINGPTSPRYISFIVGEGGHSMEGVGCEEVIPDYGRRK